MPPVRSAGGSDGPVLLSLRKVTLAADPEVGVDPRSSRSYYARALSVGRFSDPEANGAFAAFTRLVVLYHNTQMRPWIRRLTPPAKNPPATGEKIEARPTKAEDIYTALWCKASDRPDSQVQTRRAGWRYS